MSLRRVHTMFMRDLVDAIRDGRILFAVLVPVALAIYYAAVMPDPNELPTATLVVAGPTDAAFVQDVRDGAEGSLDLTVRQVDSRRQARAAATGDDDVVAIDVPSDRSAQRGEVLVFVDRGIGSDAAQLASIVEATAAASATSKPPFTTSIIEVGQRTESAFDQLGMARSSALFSIVMLAGFIAAIVVPVLLMEEATSRTLEALQMVATTAEIIVAKVFVGLVYCGLALGIVMATADLEVTHPVAFIAVGLLVSTVLVGYGLALGLALGDPGRVNTWSAMVLLPLLIPVFVVLDEPGTWATLAGLLPTGGGTLLLAEAMEPSAIDLGIAPLVALALWTVGGFALLRVLLERQNA